MIRTIETVPSNTAFEGQSSAVSLTPGAISQAAEEAAERIAGFVVETPVFVSDSSNNGSAQVLIKDETKQQGRSFKDRGAGNAVNYHVLNDEGLVVTASAGNHGKGLARAAQENGLDSIVVVGESSTREKRAGIEQYGAELEVYGQNFDEALEFARNFAGERKGKFVHPFADPLVIAGQATIGLELLRQTPDMTDIVLPVGGGGMLAGVASVIKEHKEKVRVIAAQADGTSAFTDSLSQGKPLQNQPVNPSYEGIAVGSVNPLNFEIAKRVVDGTVKVIKLDLDRMIHDFKRQRGVWLEYAGAVGPAAATLLAQSTAEEADREIVTVASGANPPTSLIRYLTKRAKTYHWN